MAKKRARVAVATRREIDRHLLEISLHSLYLLLGGAAAAGLIWISL